MRRYRWMACFCLGFLIVGCAVTGDEGLSETDENIIGGTPDRGRDPAVVALRTDDGMLCSGTLIASQWVLTARHCVSHTYPTMDCARPGRQVLSDRSPSELHVFAGDDVRTAPEVAQGRRLVVPNSDRLCEEDIALLALDRPVRGITPAPLNLHRPVVVGQRVRVVGFGLRSDRSQVLVGQRYRRDGVLVRDVDSSELAIGEGVCSGDSGGPAIDPSSGAVVGVLSRGSDHCAGTSAMNVFTRVDAFERLLSAVH